MKTIEIYDYDTNKPKFTIQTRKTKNIQNDEFSYTLASVRDEESAKKAQETLTDE